MVAYRKLTVLLISLFAAIGLLCSRNPSAAQVARPVLKHTNPSPTVTPTPDDDNPIRIETDLVNVLFTAQDKERRLLTGLKREDVRILEDGQPQEISVFVRQTDMPLSLAILIDTSTSMERALPEAKMAAAFFLDSFIRPEKDETAVVSFTGESTLEQEMTNNVARLRRAIDRVQVVRPAGYIGGGVVIGTPPIASNPALGSTAIWDAIWVTGEEILGPAPDKTRRAIILLTDGVNTYGQKKIDDAVNAALRAEAVIYAIGIGDDLYDGVDKGVLKNITERTGGRAYFPESESQLRQAFMEIQKEMRSQYLIAYEPANQRQDGSYRRIEVQIINRELTRQKVKLTHRQGYFARTEKEKKK